PGPPEPRPLHGRPCHSHLLPCLSAIVLAVSVLSFLGKRYAVMPVLALKARGQNVVIPSEVRNLLFLLFSASFVPSALNSCFLLHCLVRSPQTFATSPLPSDQSSGIFPAEFPPLSAAPIRCASIFPAGASP